MHVVQGVSLAAFASYRRFDGYGPVCLETRLCALVIRGLAPVSSVVADSVVGYSPRGREQTVVCAKSATFEL